MRSTDVGEIDKSVNDKQIPYIAYEIAQVKWERTEKRLITALVLAVVLIVASNFAWLYAWMQYDYDTEMLDEYSVDLDSMGGGNANYIGEKGNIYNGTN